MENKKKKKINCKYELIYTQAYIQKYYIQIRYTMNSI